REPASTSLENALAIENAAHLRVQQDWSFEGFGEDPAAASAHFTQTVQRPPIEGCHDRDDFLPAYLLRQPQRHGTKMKLHHSQQPSWVGLDDQLCDSA